jgi:hypothetical protein
MPEHDADQPPIRPEVVEAVFSALIDMDAVAHDPVRYRDLVASPQSKATPPTPYGARGPPSLDRPPATRP